MKYVVVGSNIICMIAALRIKDLNPRSEVLIVDKAERPGANMRTINFAGHNYDQGMQNWYDTGIEWVDRYVRAALDFSNTEYTTHLWPYHDNSGIIFNEKIQKNSPYMDVSDFKNISDIIKKIRKNAERGKLDKSSSFPEYLEHRFGIEESEPRIKNLIEKYASVDGEHQARCFEKMLPMDRVLCNRFSKEELNNSEGLRQYIGYYDRAEVPKGKNSNKFTIYPCKGGISKLVDAFLNYLSFKKISIELGAHLEYEKEQNLVYVFDNNRKPIQYESLIWGANMNFFSKPFSEIFSENIPSVSALDSSVVHVISKRPLNNSGLIYLFDLCKTPFNRITFYGELTKKEGDYYRATFELVRTPSNYKIEINNFLQKYKILESDEVQISQPTKLPWPPFFPIGFEDGQQKLHRFIMKINKLDYLISSDASKSSILMFPTARRVLENFMGGSVDD